MDFSQLKQIGPQLEVLWGDPAARPILSLASVDRPERDGLLLLGEKKYLLNQPPAGCEKLWGVVVKESLVAQLEIPAYAWAKDKIACGLVMSDPARLLPPLTKVFYQEKLKNFQFEVDGRKMGSARVHPSCQVAPDVFIGDQVEMAPHCKIHPGVVIHAGCKIEENCEIFPHATLYPYVSLGKNCRIHAGVVLGSDGFGYQFDQGKHHKIWHYGGVEIGTDVEIGANSTVDGGTFSPTEIGRGTKIDNQVQIGHNCRIGQHVIICGMVGISGSARLGDYVVVGGKAGIGPGVEVAVGCEIAGNAMVNKSWREKTQLAGHPARPLKEWLRGQAALSKILGNN